ncbi:MAG: nicotinate-nicotinamide nucleotide adenylyltransferase, partial [Nitrospinota bacterium]
MTAPLSAEPQIEIVRKAPAGIGPRCRTARLGVLGGTFNPITNAHLGLAREAERAFQLHEVLLLLPRIPPHKALLGAPLSDRLAMMKLAVEEYPTFSVGWASHGLFLDIARGLVRIYPPSTALFFLTGRDAAERVLTWDYDDPQAALAEMFSRFELIVANREGEFRLPPRPELLPYRSKIHQLHLPPQYDPISATRVRERVARGEPIGEWVPPRVAAYIAQRGLYREEAPREQR